MGDESKGEQVSWDGVFAFLIVLRQVFSILFDHDMHLVDETATYIGSPRSLHIG